ncbi:MAG: SIS domain-containing protein [Limisphaerales bacterium]
MKIAEFVTNQLVKKQSGTVCDIITNHQNAYFSGVGKSAIVARRAVASLVSIGHPAYFLDALDAFHGDFGMVKGKSVFFIFSKSNSSIELLRLLKQANTLNLTTVSISMGVGEIDGLSDYNVKLPKVDEGNLLNLPSHSITAFNYLLDLVFNNCIERVPKNKLYSTVGNAHPGGLIGASVDTVYKGMRNLDLTPIIDLSVLTKKNYSEISATISEYRAGCCFVLKGDTLLSIITDGDIRRFGFTEDLVKRKSNLESVLSVDINSTRLEALNAMKKKKVNILAVLENEKFKGCVTMSDLIT